MASIPAARSHPQQGTNVHLLLSGAHARDPAPPGAEALAGARRPLLALQRLYVLPRAHPMLGAARCASLPGGAAITFECRLAEPLGGGGGAWGVGARPRLAYLWDHVVGGHPLLPATAMLELMLAAAVAAASDGATAAGVPAVCGAAFLAPIVLPALGGTGAAAAARGGSASCGEGIDGDEAGGEGAGLILLCRFDAGSGEMVLATPAGAHATAVVSCAGSGAGAGAAAADVAVALRLVALLRASLMGGGAAPLRRAGSVGVVAGMAGDWTADGYQADPRQADAALHLGVAGPGSGARVPVAAAAYVAAGASAPEAAPGGAFAGAPLFAAHTPQGGQVSSFLLGRMAGPGSSGALTINRLETRVMSGAAARKAAAEDAASQQGGSVSYQVLWNAAAPGAALPEAAALLTFRRFPQQLATARCKLSVARSLCAVAAAAAALGVVQRLPLGALPGAALLLAAALPCGPGTGAAGAGMDSSAAAIAGLLRTAATERPDAGLQVLLGGDAAPAACLATDLFEAEPEVAAGCAGGAAAAVPRLVHTAAADGAAWVQVRPEPRSSLANLVARPVDPTQVRGPKNAGTLNAVAHARVDELVSCRACPGPRATLKHSRCGAALCRRMLAPPQLAPGPGELQLAVKAVGINFRDVLNVSGRPAAGGPGACRGSALSSEQAGKQRPPAPGRSRPAPRHPTFPPAGAGHVSGRPRATRF